jgi:hypothetical protein
VQCHGLAPRLAPRGSRPDGRLARGYRFVVDRAGKVNRLNKDLRDCLQVMPRLNDMSAGRRKLLGPPSASGACGQVGS